MIWMKYIMRFVSTASAIELKEQRSKYLDLYTFSCELEEPDENTTVMWLKAKKEAPPPVDKELYEKQFVESAVKDEIVKTENEIVDEVECPSRRVYEC